MSSLRLRRRPTNDEPAAPVLEDLLIEDEPDQPQLSAGELQAQWTGGSALATKVSTGVLWTALIAGPVALLLVFVLAAGGSAPVAPSAAPAPDRSGEQAAVSEFAGRFVAVWLRSVRGQEKQLAPYVRAARVALPEQAWPAGTPAIADIRPSSKTTWTVTVAVPVGPTTADPLPVWRYFVVSVHMDEAGALVALTLPAPVAAPRPAEAPKLDYRYRASMDAPVAAAAQQFLEALLTGTGDVSRYISPGAPITAVQPASATALKVTDVETDRELPADRAPAEGDQVRVLVTATATTGPGRHNVVQYPLTMRVRGGRWEVAQIDLAPALSAESTQPSRAPAVQPPGSASPTPSN